MRRFFKRFYEVLECYMGVHDPELRKRKVRGLIFSKCTKCRCALVSNDEGESWKRVA